MASKVEDTLRDSSGSLRNTRVRPFCLEKTRMIKADSLISDRVICKGMVRPDDAARGCGEVKEGLMERYVFRGLAFRWISMIYTPVGGGDLPVLASSG